MHLKLSSEEKQFLDEVLTELRQYQISAKDRRIIKQQLLEHIQESREYGQDGISQFGDATTLIKDFLEISEIDLHSEIKQIRKSTTKTKILIAAGFFTSIVTYIISQFLLSMFLTESFNPLHTNNSFDYNVFYQISDNSWWNAMLMTVSISASLLISVIVVFYIRKKSSIRDI